MYLLQDTTPLENMKTSGLEGQDIGQNDDVLGLNPGSNHQNEKFVSKKDLLNYSEHSLQYSACFSALHKMPLSSSNIDDNSRAGKSDQSDDCPSVVDVLNESWSDSSFEGILDEIDGDCDSYDDERGGGHGDEVMVVPLKFDNYVNKRSVLSKTTRKRRELLLDDASGFIEALRACRGRKREAEFDKEIYADDTDDDN
mmetsp:Transcript_10543/g.24981  ORF Transcript_10543/g.24981 Transcript_10543/m.24981 type:complete len:198 (-) Transcript_10543:78-671(-)